MTHSPTPTELLALRTANAALMSPDSSYDFASTIVFALGSAQLLQSPETAAELARLRAQVSELEAARERLADAMQRRQHWRSERLVSERLLSQGEIRHLTGIPLRASAEEEYRYCGADLGRVEYPFTCNRRIAHKGPCGPDWDHLPEAPHEGPGRRTFKTSHDLPEVPRG